MNQDELKLITDLSEQLKSMNTTAKDADAQKIITETISSQSDADYKLVQIVLIQNMAIDQLKQQLKTAQQTAAASPPKGFLDDLKEKLFGNNISAAPRPLAQNYAAPTGAAQPQMSSFSSPQQSVAGSSFLGQAMTIGAGVAGGMMLGNALESIFTHHGVAQAMPSETINEYNTVNNFDNVDNANLPDVSQDNLSIDGNDNSTDFDNNSDSFDGGFDDSSSGDW